MKTLDEVCNEMMFEDEVRGNEILKHHFPTYTARVLGKNGYTEIDDGNGNIVATMESVPANFKDI